MHELYASINISFARVVLHQCLLIGFRAPETHSNRNNLGRPSYCDLVGYKFIANYTNVWYTDWSYLQIPVYEPRPKTLSVCLGMFHIYHLHVHLYPWNENGIIQFHMQWLENLSCLPYNFALFLVRNAKKLLNRLSNFEWFGRNDIHVINSVNYTRSVKKFYSRNIYSGRKSFCKRYYITYESNANVWFRDYQTMHTIKGK